MPYLDWVIQAVEKEREEASLMLVSVGKLRQPLCQHDQKVPSDHGMLILGKLWQGGGREEIRQRYLARASATHISIGLELSLQVH